MKLSIARAASRELEHAVRWYRKHVGTGIADAFLNTVDEALAAILETPETSPLWPGEADVHRKLIGRRFPFSIAYRIRHENIRVLAIVHHKRRPFYWRKRI